MRYFRVGNVHVYTADDSAIDAAWDARFLLRGFFSRRKIFKAVTRAHARSHGLSLRPKLFIAHGAVRNDCWYFKDSDNRFFPVQGWIDENDGTTGTLLLFCCNSLNLEIRSRSSVVIHLNRAASRWDLFQGGCLRLQHPRFGYIENNYYRLRSINR